MSNQEEIIEVCGKKVVVRYTKDGHPCEKCVLDVTEGCNSTKCSLLDRVGMEIDERAYFADPWIRCSDCALFLGGKCTRPGGECARKAPLSEETHSLKEWAKIMAEHPDLRAEFDKMYPPQPIQGSIAPGADVNKHADDEKIKNCLRKIVGAARHSQMDLISDEEADAILVWIDRRATHPADAKPEADLEEEAERFFTVFPMRANTPGVPDEYLDFETYMLIARHFAEWGAEHLKK